MSKPQSVYFLGTKEIGAACFKILLENQSKWNLTIKGALTNDRNLGNNTQSVKELALENKVKLIGSLDALLAEPDVDFLLSVQYHLILKKPHIQKAKKLAINLHMAPLPEYRGCNQFSFAIIDKASVFGTTFHQLTEGTDSGPILKESRFNIPKDIFVKDLYELTYTKTIQLFTEQLPKIFEGNFHATPQNKLEQERGCGFHFRKEINQIKRINADWPLEKQKRFFRATFFPPFEPPILVNGNNETPLGLNWYNQV